MISRNFKEKNGFKKMNLTQVILLPKLCLLSLSCIPLTMFCFQDMSKE
jgi:hypothetical protein